MGTDVVLHIIEWDLCPRIVMYGCRKFTSDSGDWVIFLKMWQF